MGRPGLQTTGMKHVPAECALLVALLAHQKDFCPPMHACPRAVKIKTDGVTLLKASYRHKPYFQSHRHAGIEEHTPCYQLGSNKHIPYRSSKRYPPTG